MTCGHKYPAFMLVFEPWLSTLFSNSFNCDTILYFCGEEGGYFIVQSLPKAPHGITEDNNCAVKQKNSSLEVSHRPCGSAHFVGP